LISSRSDAAAAIAAQFRHAASVFPSADAGRAAETAAQTADEAYLPRSGDARIDRQLADINAYAARYPQSFVDEVARYYSVPRAYVEAMLLQPAWRPADIFMACALAQVAAQPCRNVVREWSRNHAEGWEGVAQRVQGPTGSARYRQLRERIAETYARWARPPVK
jgi:NADH:ubiquinone oxidoreductase subunit